MSHYKVHELDHAKNVWFLRGWVEADDAGMAETRARAFMSGRCDIKVELSAEGPPPHPEQAVLKAAREWANAEIKEENLVMPSGMIRAQRVLIAQKASKEVERTRKALRSAVAELARELAEKVDPL